MSVSERIGLLSGFGWVAAGPWWLVLLKCWLITPGVMLVIAPLLESRWLPLVPSRQFVSFFPGDLFLGAFAAALLILARNLPSEERWYNATLLHVLVLSTTVVIAIVLTIQELRSGAYPVAAILSPTKLYHNLVLYGGYGYVIVSTFAAVMTAARSWWLLVAAIPLVIWLGLVVADNSLSKGAQEVKLRSAHIANWHPIWVK